MIGIFLVGFVWLNLQFSVSGWQFLVGFVWLNLQFSAWLVDFQWGLCGSLFFCVMVGRFLVGFVWLNLQFSVSWLVDFQWGSCGSIFSFLCHGWQIFSGVRVAQSLVFCVMVGRLLVGFVWLNLQFSVSWLVDFQWGSCGSIFSFVSWLVDFQWGSCGSIFSFGWQIFSGVRVSWLVDFQWGSCGSIFSFLCHGWQTFSGVRVAQSLVFCVMVGRLLVGFVWLNLQFSVSWLVDFQWGSCGSIFSFLCHGWQTFSGVRVAQSLVFCVMVGKFLVEFVWLNLQFSVSWLVDFQWGSCGSIFSFLCHGWQTFSGVRVAQSLVLCHGRQTFSGVRVAQSLVLCVMVRSWLNLQFSVSWLVYFQWGSCGSIFSFLFMVDFQWGSCGSIFSFLCHGWQTFSGVRVAQSLVFCVMVGRFLVGFVWLNLQFSVSWLVDFQWGSCGSIFSFLCHGWQTFSGVRVAQSLVFCVMVGRFLVGFVWLNLQFSVSWLVDFQWGSCGSIFSFLCHGWQIFSGVRVAQSLVFCVMVGRLLVGFVWLNLQFCVMVGIFLVGFVWLNLQFSVSWLVYFQWGSCGSIFSFLCHGWQAFSGVRVALSLVFCVMVCRLLVGFVWLNLQFSVSWLVDFQWGSCGSIFSFLCHGW